ncbi:MAG: hypothetical protein ABI540_09935 [Spartobacteria bacterium]
MKRPILALLLAVFALSSCRTMHDAAVSTFRVVDAPNAYMRRKLGVDGEQQQTTTTTTTTQTGVYSDTSGNPPSQTYPAQSANVQPPPAPVQRQVVTPESRPSNQPMVQPTATPRVVRNEPVTRAETTPPPQTTTTQTSELPYGKPVPGKPGYVFSPYDKNGGYVDVTGYNPGQKVKDPYSGKIFLVP